MFFAKRLEALALIVSAAVVLSGCQVMESVSEDLSHDAYGIACRSELGSYSVPISSVKLTISQTFDTATNAKVSAPYIQIGDVIPRADKKHRFCLNFLDNGLSDDHVTVKFSGEFDSTTEGGSQVKTGESSGSDAGLLGLIVSKNVDRTGEIIQDLLQAFFIGRSRDNQFSLDRTTGQEARVQYEDEVQPFSLGEMANLNKRIHHLGFCITMGRYTHDPNLLSVNQYCDHPDLAERPEFMSARANAYRSQRYFVNRKKLPPAIYYRPRQTHQMFVYVRDDPDLGGDWELRQIKNIEMENASPIIGLNVSRVPFAESRVAFAFDRGDLRAACIARGSSAKGAIQIPLDIVYGIVQLPTKTILKEIQDFNGKTELLQAQAQVINAQKVYLEKQEDLNDVQVGQVEQGEALNTENATTASIPRGGNAAVSLAAEDRFQDLCTLINKTIAGPN